MTDIRIIVYVFITMCIIGISIQVDKMYESLTNIEQHLNEIQQHLDEMKGEQR